MSNGVDLNAIKMRKKALVETKLDEKIKIFTKIRFIFRAFCTICARVRAIVLKKKIIKVKNF